MCDTIWRYERISKSRGAAHVGITAPKSADTRDKLTCKRTLIISRDKGMSIVRPYLSLKSCKLKRSHILRLLSSFVFDLAFVAHIVLCCSYGIDRFVFMSIDGACYQIPTR